MVLKKSQLSQLAEPAKAKFINQLIILVGEQYPEEVLLEDPIQIRQRLTTLVEKARQYGFVREQHVALFVLFCMELGDDFDENSENKKITDRFKDRSITAQNRLDSVGNLIF
ncbi:hypothetical protein [Spirosoma spitsbergense]|uniref:hypothetical protein n=1 Tax=Spirosoma spitsbergense TaxID=431554 RepID=UPI0003622783|nr:hypothetical protein [Spirosoma spitsbergense]